MTAEELYVFKVSTFFIIVCWGVGGGGVWCDLEFENLVRAIFQKP